MKRKRRHNPADFVFRAFPFQRGGKKFEMLEANDLHGDDPDERVEGYVLTIYPPDRALEKLGAVQTGYAVTFSRGYAPRKFLESGSQLVLLNRKSPRFLYVHGTVEKGVAKFSDDDLREMGLAGRFAFDRLLTHARSSGRLRDNPSIVDSWWAR